MERQKRYLTIFDMLFVLLSAVPAALIIVYTRPDGVFAKTVIIAASWLVFQLVVMNIAVWLVGSRRSKSSRAPQ